MKAGTHSHAVEVSMSVFDTVVLSAGFGVVPLDTEPFALGTLDRAYVSDGAYMRVLVDNPGTNFHR